MTCPSDVREIISRLGITSEDEDFEYYQALMDDEAFSVACEQFKLADLYADHKHSNRHDELARNELKMSVREHAQRVAGEVGA